MCNMHSIFFTNKEFEFGDVQLQVYNKLAIDFFISTILFTLSHEKRRKSAEKRREDQ